MAQGIIIAEFALFSTSFAREFFDEGAERDLLLRYGGALHAVLLVPQDPGAARVAKRLKLGGASLGHRQECLCYCASEVVPVASFARPDCWWFAPAGSREYPELYESFGVADVRFREQHYALRQTIAL
jgi:hypothetical protein